MGDPKVTFNNWIKVMAPLVAIVEHFDNLHGEQFVIYRINGEYFITGDIFEWETGWKYNYHEAVKQVSFSKTEDSMIKQLIDQDKSKLVK